MIATIKKGRPKGTISAPPSKSFSHRDLIAGMLSGQSTIQDLSFSEDVLATLDCAKGFGASWERKGNDIRFLGIQPKDNDPEFPCRESGSTLRFFLPLALTRFSRFTMTGAPRLFERGLEAYRQSFASRGISITPISNGVQVAGKLTPGVFEIDASQSSQYVTGLLFALPLLDGDSEIRFVGEVSSCAYIEMTWAVLRDFGIEVQRTDSGFLVPGKQTYLTRTRKVEGDYSNAAFLGAFASLGCGVNIEGLNPNSLQGDKIYLLHFPVLAKGFCTIDVDSCIDLAPVLFALAALHHGAHFTGISRLAIKESNRAEAMKEELQKVGSNVKIQGDEAWVNPASSIPPAVCFSAHNDHRIAMALSLFSVASTISIDGAECVKKSYPDYFEVLSRLGMEVDCHA